MLMGELGLSLLIVALTVGIANVCLLLFLLKAYWKTYKQIKSGFTIGLLYFSSFLLLQNVMSTLFIAINLLIPIDINPVNIYVSEIHGPRLPLFLINIVQLVALSILFKITRE
ncbi:hypothetical protein [Methanobacterium petrolearium]|uniref:hypothetical protein n=1 Tax=Methanobacterium petrolearium TaxID=710190 RepID=UPI001AE29495|nr:hypothetical protein [Methanobacterium petrolearium]MBP1946525.1 hypothetical protein [Methanobacterium petrolearium]BDZ69869.1 hypothetical protein GCM10025861_03860 [Methanobacterium petrolearium]